MIIQLTIGNFLSFKEQSTLSLAASALKDIQVSAEDILFNIGDTELTLVKSAVIYGANASGKSNFIKAFEFLKWYIINSSKDIQAGERVNVESFRLNSETADEPSYFEVIFSDEGNQYRYGFEADNAIVHSEWLYQKSNKKRAKEVELFYREKDKFDIHSKFIVGKEVAGKKMVRSNALLLSVAAQFNDPTSVEIMGWLNDTTIISSSNDEKIWNIATIQLNDVKMKQRIVEFSRYADLGIENIEKVDNTIISTHIQYDDKGNEIKSVTFPFRKNESEGTIKYFSLAYPIIDALDNGKRLIIDEFDSKMHPLLTCRIIALFNSKETNPKNAQLIFTTHDTNLLSANIFRRDQIWFTQKDRYGATDLYSLAEYKVRNDASFEKDYLSGKYGAIPILGDLTRLFYSKEQ
ncbi:ATP/GTP-binding protein [Bacteroides sp.]|uniref:AAA family ATPase n=1 Tax=Bacteroides sp. TaxID=29523 RepID=UPI0026362CCF|nr:ATP-binding protein [Bacteroides sp.]